MAEVGVFLWILSGILFALGGLSDLWIRAIPAPVVGIMILASGTRFVVMFDGRAMDSSLHKTGLAVTVLVIASVVGVVSIADALSGLGLALLALSSGPGIRSQVVDAGIWGTLAAIAAWYLYRCSVSIGISGLPKNIWDCFSLTFGRLEREPGLRRHHGRLPIRIPHGFFLTHLEALRTSDGYHLYPDSCPLVMCFFSGYACMSIVWVMG